MEQKTWMVLMFVMIIVKRNGVEAYKNYTVGEDLGWFDKLEKSIVNYQKWASSYTFSLGDFLIFNTDNNHTVVQTYNSTTYHLCDDSNALDNDTFQWASPDPSAATVHPVSVAVPLLKEGPTYFFSGDYDGEQCENGQRFSINVTHGQGLPLSLRTPPEGTADGPVGQQSGDDESAPDTLVPANFDHPKDISDDDDDDDDDKKKKTSNASAKWELRMVLIVLGLICSCW